MLRFILPLVLATAALAQDVYVPPVPIGVKRDGKVRKPRSPIAFPDERKPWIRIRSAHYDVLSSGTAEQTREIVSDLETLASALTSTSSRFSNAPTRTTVLVFADRSESEPYFELLLGRDNPPATGLHVRHPGGGTMFIDASRRKRRIEKTALHELVHDLLRHNEQTPPHWIEEGLAEYFSSAEIRDGKVTAGAPMRQYLSLVRRSKPLTLNQMFTIRAETDEAMTPQFYAHSWAAVDWLMRTDRKAFFPFLDALERGTTPADALQTHYKKTLRDMEIGIRAGSLLGHHVELTVPTVTVPEDTPLPRATLLYELGRFLSYVAGAEEDSQRLYAEALRVDPRHARALAATGLFEEAIAAGLEDPEVHLAYAETLLTTALGPFAGIFEPAAGDTEKFRKARALGERALALGAEEGAARAAIGTTWLVETDLRPGIEQLERARELLPKRHDIALNLYAMLLRSEQVEKAAALYAASFEHSRDKQVVFAAKNVRLVAETSRATALAKAGKLDEAAKIVRGLAAGTADAIARRELEAQAASLESLATVNRQIVQYNEAIALANSGRTGDAARVLEDLLAVVQDPQLARDARKFQEELRKR